MKTDKIAQLYYQMNSIRITHKIKYVPVPKHGRNLEWCRKLEQTLENGPYSTTLLSDELYKDHTQKKYAPVPKHGRNLEWHRKLEQTLENRQYSTTLLPNELYKDHTQKKNIPPYQNMGEI